ncbi:COQ9 family protein [Sediminicoccus sp. KRV36]|uniref:COQ9 family protein n=1 Tax=Sediminicoccus sp. KRV36 TaxID=3133721 RepID=UPI00200D8CA8|nr:COQ9 family protein [Sediminicoccus rosea]UPY36487.1 COQ9 family protein [Sediminicoccus rosea]
MSDAAWIHAAVRRAGKEGWSRQTLRHALEDCGDSPELISSAFPRGVTGAIDAWAALTDARMDAAAAAEDLASLRTPARIQRVIEIRLQLLEPDREALRAALGLLALPWNAPTALRLLARTVSAIWHAAGDNSADFSWYTRRATLAGVYSATLAYWMRPIRPEMDDVLSFLDRRLQDLPKPRRKAA